MKKVNNFFHFPPCDCAKPPPGQYLPCLPATNILLLLRLSSSFQVNKLLRISSDDTPRKETTTSHTNHSILVSFNICTNIIRPPCQLIPQEQNAATVSRFLHSSNRQISKNILLCLFPISNFASTFTNLSSEAKVIYCRL